MKTLLRFALLALLAPQAPQTPAPMASLQGRAIQLSSGQPMSKVIVDLRGPSSLQTTTEEDGKFYFPNVQPGQYHLYARHEGYALAEYGQRWSGGPGQLIALAAAQPTPNVEVGLTYTAVISGRITDFNGNPITGARVRAMKRTVLENRRTLQIAAEGVTNELGEYRLFWLAPGRYYVSATVQAWQVNSQIVNNPVAPIGDTSNAGLSTSRSVSRPETTKPIGTGAADDEIYIPLYFPRTADGEQASPIDVQPGVDYKGVDLSVGPVHTYHVKGRLTNLPTPAANPQAAAGGRAAPPLPPAGGFPGRGAAAGGGPGGGPAIAIRLTPVDSLGYLPPAVQANATTGEFDFPKVVNGAYTLYTFIDGTTTRMPVEVRNADVDGIALPLAMGVSLPVQITLDGEPPKNLPDISSLGIMLYRDPTLIGAPAMQGRGGEIPNLSPGDYRIYVTPLIRPIAGTDPMPPPPQWQNAYVKSIRLGDTEVLSGGLRYEPKPDSRLDIVIGTNPGTVEGRVLNDQQQAIPSAAVVLFAEPTGARITRTDMFRTASTDRVGSFQVKGLPPGDYRVYAWEGLDKDTWLDPDFVQNESRGRSIHIEEGKTSNVDVPIISPVR
ncbi:MAG TPA: carboxypeptidase-like regulatory domain-containing protein [Terriglobia bacterium]|nr:carboxypeptidase-like regulatory domain-containing protein [Terriglobia bacterium]